MSAAVAPLPAEHISLHAIQRFQLRVLPLPSHEARHAIETIVSRLEGRYPYMQGRRMMAAAEIDGRKLMLHWKRETLDDPWTLTTLFWEGEEELEGDRYMSLAVTPLSTMPAASATVTGQGGPALTYQGVSGQCYLNAAATAHMRWPRYVDVVRLDGANVEIRPGTQHLVQYADKGRMRGGANLSLSELFRDGTLPDLARKRPYRLSEGVGCALFLHPEPAPARPADTTTEALREAIDRAAPLILRDAPTVAEIPPPAVPDVPVHMPAPQEQTVGDLLGRLYTLVRNQAVILAMPEEEFAAITDWLPKLRWALDKAGYARIARAEYEKALADFDREQGEATVREGGDA